MDRIAPSDHPASSKRPLDGILVVDFTSMVAGPWATRLLADCGAEVVKIEAVGDGDFMRFAPPVNDRMSRIYAHLNCGKKSVSLDLKSDGGRSVARDLVRRADIVVENFRPGVMARLGLDYDSVAKDNPTLVYCSVSGFGQTGPDAGKAAYAPVVHASSGYDHVQALAQGGDGAPLNGGVMVADFLAATYAFGAIQTAMLLRERTGEGSYVDVTLIESMMSLVAIQLAEAQSPTPLSSRVFKPLKTADGHIMVPLVSPKTYVSVYRLIGREDWLSDPEFTTIAGLQRHAAEIEKAVGAWAAALTTEECEAALATVGAPSAGYVKPADLFDNAHLTQRGSFAILEDAAGSFKVLNPPFKLSGVDCVARPEVSRPGEDTASVVGGLLGLGDEGYRRLKAQGAFG